VRNKVKLRYYLRGLGIGIVVTALLMGVALKGNKPLSDAEIRVRAMELGMVDGDPRTLADIQASQDPGQSSPDASVPEETPEPVSTTEPVSTAEPTPAAEPEATSDPEADSLKPLPMVTPRASSDPGEETPEQSDSVTFVIHSGQNSYTISKSLVEAGLVEDALDFDRYLEEKGYSKRISTGTYEIPVGSTQEEIAEIIAGSR